VLHGPRFRSVCPSTVQDTGSRDLRIVSVACKVGRTPKETIGVRDEEKIRIGQFESMCSPIAQAMILDEEKTDFNILVGLCVGHDSQSYYSKLKQKGFQP
jgi:uncharacterized metal-binding protein